MSRHGQQGTTLVMGMILLSLVTLLGLAGASTAHIERLLAQNSLFRENAASAASAGIEAAIQTLVTTPDTVSVSATGVMPGSNDRYETRTRFVGYEAALPQAPGARVAGAHFEIVSSGFSSRRAADRQRADILMVVDAPATIAALDCEPVAPGRCFARGDWLRLSWQRMSVE